MLAGGASSTPGIKEEKRKRVVKGFGAMPQNGSKVLADEEMARRLHEELNGPEGGHVSPSKRRNRKAPCFYTPPVPGGNTSSNPSEAVTQPEDVEGAQATEDDHPKPERAGSSGTKRPGKAVQDDSGENSPATPSSRHRGQKRQKTEADVPAEKLVEKSASGGKTRSGKEEPQGPGSTHKMRHANGGLQLMDSASDFAAVASGVSKPLKADKAVEPTGSAPATRSSNTEDALLEKRPSLRMTRSAGDSKSEDLVTPKTGPPSRAATRESGQAPNGLGASSSQNSDQQHEAVAARGGKVYYPKVPKLPMCRQGNNWYRARKVSETKTKVLLEFPGVVNTPAVWLAKDSSRIWTGSYKGRDWKHLGDGAWEPKVKEEPISRKPGCGRGRKRRNQERSQADSSSDGEISDDEDDKAPSSMPDSEAGGSQLPQEDSRPASSTAQMAPQQSQDVEVLQVEMKQDPGSAETVDAEAAEPAKVEPSEPAAPLGKGSGRRGRPPGAKKRKLNAAAAAAAAELQKVEAAKTQEAEEGAAAATVNAQAKANRAASNEVSVSGERQRAEDAVDVGETEEGSQPDGEKNPKRAVAVRGPDKGADVNGGAAMDCNGNEFEQAGHVAGEGSREATVDEHSMRESAAATLLAVAASPLKKPAADLPVLKIEDSSTLTKAEKLGSSTDALPQSSHPPLKMPGSGLGALAQALANASACRLVQSPAKQDTHSPVSQKSRRTRKRATKANLEVGDNGGGSQSGHSNSPTEADNGSSPSSKADHGRLSAKDDRTGSHNQPSGTWKGAWKEKHLQRLMEIEAEDEAAAHTEVDGDAQHAPRQPAQRPIRAIRAPRCANVDRSDGLQTRSSRETDNVSPPTPAPRTGRGRGRWANHVKRGGSNGRTVRPSAPASPAETPRSARAAGRPGRRGGRGAHRAVPKVEPEDVRMATFSGLVEAMDRKASTPPPFALPAPKANAVSAPPPCHHILDIPPENFLRVGWTGCDDVKEFRMPPPPVPLFKAS